MSTRYKYTTKYTFNKFRVCIKIAYSRGAFTFKYAMTLISLLYLFRRASDTFGKWAVCVYLFCDLTLTIFLPITDVIGWIQINHFRFSIHNLKRNKLEIHLPSVININNLMMRYILNGSVKSKFILANTE